MKSQNPQSLVFLIILIAFSSPNNSGLATSNSNSAIVTFIDDFETDESLFNPSITIDSSNNPNAEVNIDSTESAINEKSLHFQGYTNSTKALISIIFDLNLPISNSEFFGFYYKINHLGGNYRLSIESTSSANLEIDYGVTSIYYWEPQSPILDTPNIFLQDNTWHFFETNVSKDIENGLALSSTPYQEFIPDKIVNLIIFFDQGYVNNEMNTDFIFFNSTYVSNQELEQLVLQNKLTTTSGPSFSINGISESELSNVLAYGLMALVIIFVLVRIKKLQSLRNKNGRNYTMGNPKKMKFEKYNEIRKCPKCHSNIDPSDMFCYKCGKEVSLSEAKKY